jgi:hypothetical protein
MTTTMIYMPELIKQLEVALNASTDQITCGKGLEINVHSVPAS